MADKHSKTEKPTGKRKNEARKKGNIPRSPDLTTWSSLLVISFIVPKVLHTAENRMVSLFYVVNNAIASPNISSDIHALHQGVLDAAIIVAPILLTGMAVGLIGNFAQVGKAFSPSLLKPKWSRLNPKSGFKRIFSPHGLWELVKQTIKLVILGFVAYRTMRTVMTSLSLGGPFSISIVLKDVGRSALTFVRLAAFAGVLLAVIDYIINKKKIGKSMMMSKQEVKEEGKQQEGNPQIKGEVRKRQREFSMNRMMSSVRYADVIVANPTHYAVAIRYEKAKGAPRVLAKGIDNVALRIREEAENYHIAIVEDPPLARSLYRVCELNQEIPRVLFEAVARLLAFVYSLKASGRLRMYNTVTPPTGFLPHEILEKPVRSVLAQAPSS